MRFGWRLISNGLIFISAFFRTRASLGCDLVATRSELRFYLESIRQKKHPRSQFTQAFHLLWALLSAVCNGWESAAGLIQPKTWCFYRLLWQTHPYLIMVKALTPHLTQIRIDNAKFTCNILGH
jgi:hypothetical protein